MIFPDTSKTVVIGSKLSLSLRQEFEEPAENQ
jgi:hypothetical protein